MRLETILHQVTGLRQITGRASKRRPTAFTLVELILTLALAVVLMAMLGTAISFYAEKLDARDSEVRRMQLAQAILNMLSDDLRVAIYPPEFDDAALNDLLTSAGGGQPSQPGEGEDLSAAGLDDMSGSGDDFDSDALLAPSQSVEIADISAGSMSTSRPGLLGNQTQIQFDVSRLPRLEEYQRQMVSETVGEMIDIPSDIKTISYFLQPPGGGVTDPLEILSGNSALSLSDPNSPELNGGLVRRSLDRAVTSLAMTQGGMTTLSSTGDLIATEVASLEFRYWDGLMWQVYWDSDEFGCLPVAIEVTLTMLEPNNSGDTNISPEALTRQYIQIIRLPMGRPVETDTTAGLSAAGL